jgi:hypothetical protein
MIHHSAAGATIARPADYYNHQYFQFFSQSPSISVPEEVNVLLLTSNILYPATFSFSREKKKLDYFVYSG